MSANAPRRCAGGCAGEVRPNMAGTELFLTGLYAFDAKDYPKGPYVGRGWSAVLRRSEAHPGAIQGNQIGPTRMHTWRCRGLSRPPVAGTDGSPHHRRRHLVGALHQEIERLLVVGVLEMTALQ
jgi:hypothetical protein